MQVARHDEPQDKKIPQALILANLPGDFFLLREFYFSVLTSFL